MNCERNLYEPCLAVKRCGFALCHAMKLNDWPSCPICLLKLCHRHQLNEDSKFSKLCWFFAYWIFIIELINPESNMKFRRPLINIFYCLGHILPRHMLKLFYFVSIFAWCSSSRFKQVIDSDDWPQKGRIRKVFNGCSEQIFESLRSSGW